MPTTDVDKPATQLVAPGARRPPFHVRTRVRWALLFRRATAALRVLPDFLILGGQRCGSTSLYHYLVRHPAVLPAFNKEVHFFDNAYPKGLSWYRTRFPTALGMTRARARHGRAVTGEASPYYLFHPHAPRRIQETLPEARLIAVLRDPVRRAYSHYQKKVWKGIETLSFEEALDREEERLRGERERMLADERYRGVPFQEFSYLARGRYAEQLEAWFERFPREQLLILKSEELYRDPPATLARVARFLELPEASEVWQAGSFAPLNRRPAEPMLEETRRRLEEYFAPHNQRLAELLGEGPWW